VGIEGDRGAQVARGVQCADVAVVPLVDLIGGQRLLRGRLLAGERDIAELGADVSAEPDVCVIVPVRVDSSG
jgi:hypothetical protein